MSKNVAVILFNHGYPDSLEAVKPFLFNVFYDPAFLTVSNPMRWMMARSISKQCAPKARDIYRELADNSSIHGETEKQKVKLEAYLNKLSNDNFKCFAFMRYWTPLAKDILDDLKNYSPEEIIMLPLYPQYSITTTGSGLIEWNKKLAKANFNIPFRVIKDYPESDFFIDTMADMINEKLKKIDQNKYRLLLCAQAIPKKTIEAGDPYQTQVERSVSALLKKIENENLDAVICYQRRLGPLEQIGPTTEDQIEKAAADNKNIIIIPISYVSECSETLVELDIQYKEVAAKAGIKDYIRIKTVRDSEKFIAGMSNLVMENRV